MEPGGYRQQQDAQYEEQQVDRNERYTVTVHVFLGFTKVAARKVFLHHVLVEPCHHDGDEDTAEELFEEILFRLPVVEHEDAAVFIARHQLYRFFRAQPQCADYLIQNQS